MIVVEESDFRKSHWPNPDPNAAVATSSTPLIPAESPPAYSPREDAGPSSSSAPPYSNPPPPPTPQKRQPKPAAIRFFEALVLAVGVYAAVAFVVRSLMHIIGGPPHDVRRTRHLSHMLANPEYRSEVVFSIPAPQNGRKT